MNDYIFVLKIIENNPYRVLGVYSNSPKSEQIANKKKLQAFLKIKKSIFFPEDMTPLLPPLQRTYELVNEASAKLSLVEAQTKYAYFWFIKKTHLDEIAFSHLIEGDIKAAKEVWGKETNMSSLQNQFVLELICLAITKIRTTPLLNNTQKLAQANRDLKTIGLYGSLEEAINKFAIPLYDDYLNEFVKEIGDNYKVSPKDYMHSIIDTLFETGCKFITIDNIIDNEWADYIRSKKSVPLVNEIEVLIIKARQSKGKDNPDTALAAGYHLMQNSMQPLKDLSGIISDKSTQYQLVADKVAMCVIDCMVDYYNVTKDLDRVAKAMPLCDYACKIAKGAFATKRASENRKTINPNGKHSEEVYNKIKAIKKRRRIFKWVAIFAVIMAFVALVIAIIINTKNAEERRLQKAETKGVMALHEIAILEPNSSIGIRAQERVQQLTDSLYSVADNANTIEAWQEYQSNVPTDYFKDSSEKMHELCFATESSAWEYAESENTTTSYYEYLNHYPNGAHRSLADKRIIDIEVDNIYSGNHGFLPPMEQKGNRIGRISTIYIRNKTSYTLTILYSGEDSKRIVISPQQSSKVTLKNGSYKIAASVDASNVGNFAGTEELEGCSYDVEYYISHRYRRY